MIARPSWTTSDGRDATRAGTARANTGASGAEVSFIHRYAGDAQIPKHSATTRGNSPVALTSAISRARSSAVCRSRMPAATRHPENGLKRWAWRAALTLRRDKAQEVLRFSLEDVTSELT